MEDEENESGVSRMMAGSNRDRLVDCAEEFVKYTIIMRQHLGLFGNRYSERSAADAKVAAAAAAEVPAPAASEKVNGVDLKKI